MSNIMNHKYFLRGGLLLSILLMVTLLYQVTPTPDATAAPENVSFSSSGLDLGGLALNNPTSLMFGPDGRLYVTQQYGDIYALNITRTTANDYDVINSEQIDEVKNIPNYNDDGSFEAGETDRQVTGVYATGSASNPVLYVTSSDPRIGGGGGGTDLGFDTNSGIISKLTCAGMDGNNQCTGWTKVDIVRGLPRSEENHASNGMALDTATNTLYMGQGGHTNAGAPSNNFAFTIEYAYAAAILSIDLDTIEAMQTQVDSKGQSYKYNLPTLDTVGSHTALNGTNNDWGDPWGGDDGLNQAMLDPNGPVQVYSPGWRNPYDVVLTANGRLYSVDNGANSGWGGFPQYEESYDCTNEWLSDEPGSSDDGPDPSTYPVDVTKHDGLNGTVATDNSPDSKVNNKNGLHLVTQGYYAGHPHPLRANPDDAGIYYHDGNSGAFYGNGNVNLPSTWPPVPSSMANPVECDFQNSGVDDGTIANIGPSANGITEYTASNFSGALQGTLLVAAFNGNIYQYQLDAAGTTATNCTGVNLPANCHDSFASGFGSTPLDVIALGDTAPFPGTVWAATYGADDITVFEPADYDGGTFECDGTDDPNIDEDSDGYDNADEIDNGTDPCSGASKPNDNDGDLTSDLNDPDDDDDTLPDTVDVFQLDANNGTDVNLPQVYTMFGDRNGPHFFGLGFTGLMANGSDYLGLIDDDTEGVRQIVAGGTAGIHSDIAVNSTTANGSTNTQQNAFQFGINTSSSTDIFTIRAQMLGPFIGYDANTYTELNNAEQGIYIGAGDQNNYLKLVVDDGNGTAGGFSVVSEVNGVVTTHSQTDVANILDEVYIDLYLTINPATGTVQARYALQSAPNTIVDLGSPVTLSGNSLAALQGTHQISGINSAFAVGIIATSEGADEYIASWDFIELLFDGDPELDVSPSSINFGDVEVNGSMTQAITLSNTGGVTADDITISDVTVTGTDASKFSTDFTSNVVIAPGETATINARFSPDALADGQTATVNITHDGTNGSPQQVTLTGDGVASVTGTALYRVNVGGEEVAAADNSSPNWSADTVTNTSTYLTEVGSDDFYALGDTGSYSTVLMTNDSLDDAESAPVDIFEDQRFDKIVSNAAEMEWDFPVTAGRQYEIRIFMAELYRFNDTVGERVFDISVEGSVPGVFNDIDANVIAPPPSPNTSNVTYAFMLSSTIEATDSMLNLEFVHGSADHPQIAGIEIIELPDPMNITINSPADNASIGTDDVMIDWSTVFADSLSGDHVHLYLDTTVYEDRITGLPITGTYTFNDLAPGAHYVVARVADVGHNEYVTTSPTNYVNAEARVDFVIGAPPEISISSPITGTTLNDSTVTINWSSTNTDPGDSVRVSIQGGASVSGQAVSGSYDFTGLTDGDYTFVCEILDGSNNVRDTELVIVTLSVPDNNSPTPTPSPTPTVNPPSNVCDTSECSYLPAIMSP